MAVSLGHMGFAEIKYVTHEEEQERLKRKLQKLKDQGRWPIKKGK